MYQLSRANVFNQYCISIASAYLYLPTTADKSDGYFYRDSDLFFLRNIDIGFRLDSIGWDRASLLLNIAFNLQIKN